jgi:hypothetical protein
MNRNVTKKLTYGQLFRRLKKLGYKDQKIKLNGYTSHVLRHKDIETATIFLPERPLATKVHPMHLFTVRTVLKNHGVVEDDVEAILALFAPQRQTRRGAARHSTKG